MKLEKYTDGVFLDSDADYNKVRIVLKSLFRDVPAGEQIKALVLEGEEDSVIIQALTDEITIKYLREKGKKMAEIIGCKYEEVE
jgi:hypothetical protein